MRPASLWNDVRALIEKGERPVINLTKGALVIERRSPGSFSGALDLIHLAAGS